VIGIDEVDKIEDPAEARAFFNQIKGLFGDASCLFLISISDDAMAAFERRGGRCWLATVGQIFMALLDPGGLRASPGRAAGGRRARSRRRDVRPPGHRPAELPAGPRPRPCLVQGGQKGLEAELKVSHARQPRGRRDGPGNETIPPSGVKISARG
jgi:hypothetical protein